MTNPITAASLKLIEIKIKANTVLSGAIIIYGARVNPSSIEGSSDPTIVTIFPARESEATLLLNRNDLFE